MSQDLSVLNLVILKKAEKDLPGLTDTEKPRMFNLTKDDDVRKYVNTYRRKFTNTSFFPPDSRSSVIAVVRVWPKKRSRVSSAAAKPLPLNTTFRIKRLLSL
uniref:Uncharacterized protein n=1 Tax=Brassica oleracea var. oleracea TaxID=109376 RepID=A0A0D3B9M9_BRAOL